MISKMEAHDRELTERQFEEYLRKKHLPAPVETEAPRTPRAVRDEYVREYDDGWPVPSTLARYGSEWLSFDPDHPYLHDLRQGGRPMRDR